MNAEDALRYLGHQAQKRRETHAPDALALLIPGLLEINSLQPMDAYEAATFSEAFKYALAHDFRFDSAPSGVGCGGMT